MSLRMQPFGPPPDQLRFQGLSLEGGDGVDTDKEVPRIISNASETVGVVGAFGRLQGSWGS